MRRHGNLWDKITDPENLYLAYKRARRGKSSRFAVRQFEKDINGNLIALQKLLCTESFITSQYKTKTIHEPKQREIYILPFFPDRIVQHALLQILIPIWDNLMIHDSYACRVGKGMHDASRKTMQHVRKYKYCLKCDIRKFYPSIDHDVLFSIVSRKIKCARTLFLVENIIRSFDGGKNTPIGNYTSQWFGNLYMNELDTKMKHMHKVKSYVRYCDDFIMFDDCKKKLQSLKTWIEHYIGVSLQLVFSKSSIFPVSQGVDFLGYRHFPEKILLRKSTAKRVIKRMRNLPNLLLKGIINIQQYQSSIASTRGWLKWANTHNLGLRLDIISIIGVRK